MSHQVEEFENSRAYHSYNMIKQKIALDQSYLDRTRSEISYLSLNLKELSRLAPEQVRLLSYEYLESDTDENMRLIGIVATRQSPPEIVLAEFVERLSASPFYDNVSVARHAKRNVKSGFEIKFHIKMKGQV
jgi:hypothetical protein